MVSQLNIQGDLPKTYFTASWLSDQSNQEGIGGRYIGGSEMGGGEIMPPNFLRKHIMIGFAPNVISQGKHDRDRHPGQQEGEAAIETDKHDRDRQA